MQKALIFLCFLVFPILRTYTHNWQLRQYSRDWESCNVLKQCSPVRPGLAGTAVNGLIISKIKALCLGRQVLIHLYFTFICVSKLSTFELNFCSFCKIWRNKRKLHLKIYMVYRPRQSLYLRMKRSYFPFVYLPLNCSSFSPRGSTSLLYPYQTNCILKQFEKWLKYIWMI